MALVPILATTLFEVVSGFIIASVWVAFAILAAHGVCRLYTRSNYFDRWLVERKRTDIDFRYHQALQIVRFTEDYTGRRPFRQRAKDLRLKEEIMAYTRTRYAGYVDAVMDLKKPIEGLRMEEPSEPRRRFRGESGMWERLKEDEVYDAEDSRPEWMKVEDLYRQQMTDEVCRRIGPVVFLAGLFLPVLIAAWLEGFR
jgi:hypothetical protein